jgi:hypothetical protein
MPLRPILGLSTRAPVGFERQKREATRRSDKGEETLAEIGRSYNVSGWTIGRISQL